MLTARENPLGGELEEGISCLDVSDISSKSHKNEKGLVMSTSPGLLTAQERFGDNITTQNPREGRPRYEYGEKNNMRTNQTEMGPVEGNGDTEILGGYRQTKAFQTLLRRQAQAVRKIQRIKSSFTKKRQ